MAVLRQMEHAIDQCNLVGVSSYEAIHALDVGVAFYTGSLQGSDGSGQGQLLYQLAKKRCKNYATCDSSGNAKVNNDLEVEFLRGQNAVEVGDCATGRAVLERVAALMAVPLIQGAMRYAYKVAHLGSGVKGKAEGAVFMAAVVPRLAFCNTVDAAIVQANMGLDAMAVTTPNFTAVKGGFERNYDCLNISCAD
eukprot:4927413-Prymnesium_polylepis.1